MAKQRRSPYRKLEIVLERFYDHIYDTDKDYLYHGAFGLGL
jgi:hypothetical protein